MKVRFATMLTGVIAFSAALLLGGTGLSRTGNHAAELTGAQERGRSHMDSYREELLDQAYEETLVTGAQSIDRRHLAVALLRRNLGTISSEGVPLPGLDVLRETLLDRLFHRTALPPPEPHAAGPGEIRLIDDGHLIIHWTEPDNAVSALLTSLVENEPAGTDLSRDAFLIETILIEDPSIEQDLGDSGVAVHQLRRILGKLQKFATEPIEEE